MACSHPCWCSHCGPQTVRDEDEYYDALQRQVEDIPDIPALAKDVYACMQKENNYKYSRFYMIAMLKTEFAYPYLSDQELTSIVNAIEQHYKHTNVRIDPDVLDGSYIDEDPHCEQCGINITGPILHDDVFHYTFCSTKCIKKFIE